ncbi:hypothetical protein TREMEDRAFT_67947 [Tremella mesenterica DSM 1558]|uniref:uncharacterized protein n=1 Tax=Tremella mesenterica (strain ATCC 24925 / CBS 8224 / DSM 1558 / NBRC 9311 / NRRL Y-6157 / RJB 2259-6 / UBC 559-6) TaxID=578456 RepID=UPI0003F48C20|nr:uncharacterized protein TREMEDRAFT_67947 [Tremella mesenterica DSM 1558]EIW71757.1 hypothetical protein TREMEDRAFT_67947 [Tremella mesenterica DSM 1558]
MDAFGLPMAFGKKAKTGPVNLSAKVATTKRSEVVLSPPPPSPPAQKPEIKAVSPEPGPSQPVFTASQDESDDEEIGPAPPSNGKRKADEDGGQDEGDEYGEEDEEEEEVDRTPISHEIVLKDHTKVVTALAVDPPGARLATGSHDYDTKLWDFGGMDARLKPFKSFEANGNYHVRDLDYSLDGQHLLIISGTVQPKIFSRDGDEEIEFNKGDVYLRDMKNTQGHTAEINAGSYHPLDKTQFLTCSNDSTLRIWDVANKRKQKQVIVVKSKERGARTRVTACGWSHDGKMVAGACLDGTLHIWNTSSNFARSNLSNETAHTKNTETTGLAFARDGHRITTRGGDDTVKLASDLGNIYPDTNVIFSPDDRIVLTGTAAPKGQKGSLVFLSGDDLAVQRKLPLGEGSVVRVLWHSRINQIFASLSTGAVHVLYSPHSSIHGALLPLAKMPRTAPRDISFSVADLNPVIYTPEALPMFADKKYGESLHQKEKRSKKFKPMEPVSGVGRGGRVGGSTTQGFVQSLFSEKIDPAEDPREALLKYAEKKEKEKE